MLALFQTLFDIVRLRKGPDAIPYSWLLCLVVLALWIMTAVLVSATSPDSSDQDFLYGIFVGVVGLAAYASIVVLFGRTPRLLQTITAIVGCGALINLLFIVGKVALVPSLGLKIAGNILTLLLFWSIAVEGHIVARAIDQPRIVGILAAIAVFFFQLFVLTAINPAPGTTA